MSSKNSVLQLLFDPQKLKNLSCPFSFFGKAEKAKNIKIVSLPFTDKNIDQFCRMHALSEEDWAFKSMTSKMIKAEKNFHQNNYRILNLKMDEDVYVQKYLSTYYYNYLFSIANILKNNQGLYHRFKISEKRFRNSVCSFAPLDRVELSFKAEKTGSKIKLKIHYLLNGKLFSTEEVQRFKFLIRRRDIYYFLTKEDWNLLEQLESEESFTYSDFNTKILKQLKNYSVDLTSVYSEEFIEILPEKLIHISELGGEMLLFLPRWNYDGHLVDDEEDTFTLYNNDKKTTYIRNKNSEKETLDFLEQAHPKFKGKNQFYLKFKEASKNNWFFHFYHNQLKDNFTITGMDMLGYFRYSEFKAETDFEIIKTTDNLVTARFVTHFGKEKIKTVTLQKALIEGNDFALLKDQSLGVLTDEWKANYGSILRNSHIEEDEITFAKWILLIPQKKEITKQADRVLPKNWMEKWKRWNQSTEIIYPQPEQINAQLRPYQQKGYEWFNMMAEIGAGTLLADDMGLGKTLQAITAMQYWLKNKPESKFLIVCPASLIYNWEKEFEKFAPHITSVIYHGSDRNIEQFLIDKNNVLITSYALVRNDQNIFSSIVWDAVVLDESHQIKNTQAQKTRAVMEINSHRRILLNGTPIMNSVEDLFPQLHFLLPQLFPSLDQFRKQFVNPVKKGQKEAALEELRILTQPFLLRRTKEFAAPDLPAKTETTLWCEMKPDQRQAYEELKSQIRNNILVQIADNGVQKAKFGVLQGINKLRQMCSSPHLVNDDFGYAGASSIKVQNLIEILTSDLADKKVLVFSQFLGTMDLLQEEFKKNNIQYRCFSGKTPAEKRIALVDEFQAEDSKIQVFLLSLMAGNSGINLTNANYVFLLEPWWNKAVQQQAIDRVHRIGQTQNVFAYNMICKDSIEEKIKFIQDQKHSLSEEVITDDEGFLKNLSEEDIYFLFE